MVYNTAFISSFLFCIYHLAKFLGNADCALLGSVSNLGLSSDFLIVSKRMRAVSIEVVFLKSL